MSRNLASLRTLLNDELLVRVGNEMQPTPYALSIQPGLRRNLADLQRLVRTGGTFDPGTADGTLRVAAPGHLAAPDGSSRRCSPSCSLPPSSRARRWC